MKISALVNVVTTDVSGKTVDVRAGKIADVQQDMAEYLIEEGFAEKAKKSAEITAFAAKPKTKQRITQTTNETDEQKAEARAARKAELAGGKDPDKE